MAVIIRTLGLRLENYGCTKNKAIRSKFLINITKEQNVHVLMEYTTYLQKFTFVYSAVGEHPPW